MEMRCCGSGYRKRIPGGASDLLWYTERLLTEAEKRHFQHQGRSRVFVRLRPTLTPQ
jgi:hypothetical protein